MISFVSNNTRKFKKRRKGFLHAASKDGPIAEEVLQFIRSPKVIPAHNQRGLVIIVKNDKNNVLRREDSGFIPSNLKNKICIGSLASAQDDACDNQIFNCITPQNFDDLTKKYKNGLEIQTNDYAREIDSVVETYASACHSTLCIDKLLQKEIKRCALLNDFVRIFGGDGCPDVDETFKKCSTSSSYTIYYKVVECRDYSEYCPLSMGFFSIKAHGIQIQYRHALLLYKCFGRNGTYGGNRSIMKTKGPLSYFFSRKCGKQRQPTVAEGPNDDTLRPEERYHYHRKSSCHKLWPFAYKMMSYLASTTTRISYSQSLLIEPS